MDDLSEKEQIEEIRRWWSEYGWFVIGGVVIGVALLLGWNYFQGQKYAERQEASTLFETLIDHVDDGNAEAAETVLNDLTTNYPQTVYAAQSQMAVARLYMDQNRDQDAADALQSVIDSDAGDELKHIARLRLARIFLYQEKAQEVVDLLSAQDESPFSASYNEVIGDAQLALGNVGAAEAAYQKVLADPDAQGTVDLALVQWKLIDLPVIEPAAGLPEADDAAEPVAEDAVEEAEEATAEETE